MIRGHRPPKKVEPPMKSFTKLVAGNVQKLRCNRMMNKPGIQGLFLRLRLWSVMLTLGIFSVNAQDSLQVDGRILNWANEPVANVSIAVEGSPDLPAVTDESGEFSVSVVTGYEWLNVIPVGNYKGKRINVNNRNDITIYITYRDIPSGDDPVNILAQSRLKKNIISSVSVLDHEEIVHTPAMTVDEYLQGRVPGMHVVNRSGDPSSGAYTLMRGINSLNTSNQPLYVVDGIPVISVGIIDSNLDGFSWDPLLGINVHDISKVTVIKDPAITAAYGSKASNGLVIIETFTPSALETVIDLDIRSGYSLSPSGLIPQMDARQHHTLASEILFSSGQREELIREDFPNLYLRPTSTRFIDYQHNTNWQQIIFSDAVTQNINLNVRGGDEIARYGLSFGYKNANGIIKNTDYNDYNLRFVSSLDIFSWLQMNAGVSLNYGNSRLMESAKVSQTNPILTSLAKSPMLNPYRYDVLGNEIDVLAPVDELGVSNPQAIIDNYQAEHTNFFFTPSIGLSAALRNNLVLNTKFALTYKVLKEQIFMPNQGMELYYNDEAHNVAKVSNNNLNSFYNNTYLTYSRTFGTDHYFASTTGINVLMNDYEFDFGLTRNAPVNDMYRFLQHGVANLRELGGNNRKWNWVSIYESLTYSFRDKYLASASLSIDGSSRIGKNALNTFNIGNSRYGLFYGGGVGWRISSEPFLNHVSWLEELKLRMTYGISGNDDIGENYSRRFYSPVKFRETLGLYPAVISNDELTYETVSMLNVGLDISLLANRFLVNVDLYSSETKNMFVYSPVSTYLGYDFRMENSGRMENKGIDLGLFLRIIDRSDFKWDFQASYSTLHNKVLDIKGDRLVTDLHGAQIVNIPGERANSFYGYIFKGVYSTTEEALNAGLVNDRQIPYQAGDAIFADISGPDGVPDGIINEYDKTVIGSSLPKQFGGISNNFSYKRWGLSTFVQFVQGNKVFNYVRYMNESMKTLANQSTYVLNRWQYEGQETNVPRALWNDPVGNSAFSTRWIEDGSYLRVKNITLSYTFDEEFLTFRNAQFYASANNLFTLSNYLGYDPEFGYSHSQIDQGIDYGLAPHSVQFIFGVKVGL